MKRPIQRVPALIGLLAAAAGVQGGTFSDNFANGLNPAYWGVIQTTPGLYSESVSQGNIDLAKTSENTPGGLQAIYIRLNFASFGALITNDFSTQVNLSNAVVPGPGLDQVELHTYYQDGSIYYDSYDNSSGLNAHVWDGSSVQGLMPLSTNGGTFSISRTGGTVTGYFNGTPLHSETRSAPLIAIDFILQNNIGSDDATSAAFNSFSFTSSSVTVTPPVAGAFYPVSLSNSANFTWAGVSTVPGEPTAIRLPGAPTGPVVLAGIPFNIASNAAGNQAWHGDIAAAGGPGVVSVTSSVNVYAVTNVYSLINTWEGQPGPTAYAWFVFTGSAGTVYTNYLVGGENIRDYDGANWENLISAATTTNVFDCLSDNWGTPGRLDMQQITLPAAFATQTLVSIQLVDNGGPGFQRVVLDGLTVQSAQPPLSITGNGSGVTVSWPALTGATLQTNASVNSGNWAAYGGPVTTAGITNSATIAPASGDLFFRLRLP
jgi:hypothetical protein